MLPFHHPLHHSLLSEEVSKETDSKDQQLSKSKVHYIKLHINYLVYLKSPLWESKVWILSSKSVIAS